MRRVARVSDIINVVPGEHDFDVVVNIPDPDNPGSTTQYTVMGGSDFLQYVGLDYYEWSFFSFGEDASGHYLYLKKQFDMYMAEMGDSLDRIYLALNAQYDPLSNHTRHEEVDYMNTHELEYGKTDTMQYSDANGANPFKTKTTYDHFTQSYITPFDNSSGLNPSSMTEYKTPNNSNGDVVQMEGQITHTLGGTDTTTDTRERENNVTDVTGQWRTTAAKNIEEEIDMRLKNDFIDIVLKGFADKYLFLLA